MDNTAQSTPSVDGTGTTPVQPVTPPQTPEMPSAIPNVDPAMPNAMGVSMQQPVMDPNVAPNPFAQPAAAPSPSMAMPQSAPTQSGLPPISNKPEVVTNGGGNKNTPWIVMGIIAVVVVLGIMGAFAYFSFVAMSPVETAVASPAPAAVVESSPSAKPVVKEMTIDEKIAAEEASMTDLQSAVSAADKSLNDKQGDLSE